MGVRVKIRIKHNDKEIVTSALVNAGFETRRPRILIPLRLAEELHIYPPKEGYIKEYQVAGGGRIQLIECGVIKVKLEEEDVKKLYVNAVAVVSSGEKEVLLSDKLIDELGIIILKPGEGLWRHIDDPSERIRRSQKKQEW